MYISIAKCPVCGAVMDTLTHPGQKIEAVAESMLLSFSRKEHAKSSPACTDNDAWARGWDLETKKQETT